MLVRTRAIHVVKVEQSAKLSKCLRVSFDLLSIVSVVVRFLRPRVLLVSFLWDTRWYGMEHAVEERHEELQLRSIQSLVDLPCRPCCH